MDLSHSFFVVIFDLFKLWKLFFFSDALNTGFLGGIRAGRHHVSTFVASEAESILSTPFSFFRGKFLQEFDCINVHGVGILDVLGG